MTSNLDYQALLEKLTEETLELGLNTPIVVIDGRACSGKSTLAKELQNRLFQEGDSLPRLLHMDDLYPGWDGLAAGVDYLKRMILNPLKQTGSASWQEYDWAAGKRNNWREFSGGTPLIIEGCGSLNTYTASIANLTVWLSAPEELRRERWLAREGNVEKFELWSAQELDFIALEHSDTLATYFYDSSTTL